MTLKEAGEFERNRMRNQSDEDCDFDFEEAVRTVLLASTLDPKWIEHFVVDMGDSWYEVCEMFATDDDLNTSLLADYKHYLETEDQASHDNRYHPDEEDK